MNLMQVIDDPDQVLDAVLAFYEDSGEEEGADGEDHPPRPEEDRMFYL
jgi:hypothetical protein